MARINVTKSFLPPKEEYQKYIDAIWESAYFTNNGPFLQQLESELKNYLGVKNLMVCNNGTIVLQMALKALGIQGEVITTPFSYVATVNTILWENCKPVFVDIEPSTFCINTELIEDSITEHTQAILCTHVYGLPCNVERIKEIADKHKLKVIYDGAHAFGSVYNSISLLNYGDISTCSFHATKLFHTVEGGCIIVNDDAIDREIFLYRQFGHIHDDYFCIGLNGKNSELHASMGLCVLPHVPDIIRQRKEICERYDEKLLGVFQRPGYTGDNFTYNYAYYPIVIPTENELLFLKAELEKNDIFPRRYFYPTLNQLPFVNNGNSCPVSEDISRRVLCLPLYVGLTIEEIDKISMIVLKSAKVEKSFGF